MKVTRPGPGQPPHPQLSPERVARIPTGQAVCAAVLARFPAADAGLRHAQLASWPTLWREVLYAACTEDWFLRDGSENIIPRDLNRLIDNTTQWIASFSKEIGVDRGWRRLVGSRETALEFHESFSTSVSGYLECQIADHGPGNRAFLGDTIRIPRAALYKSAAWAIGHSYDLWLETRGMFVADWLEPEELSRQRTFVLHDFIPAPTINCDIRLYADAESSSSIAGQDYLYRLRDVQTLLDYSGVLKEPPPPPEHECIVQSHSHPLHWTMGKDRASIGDLKRPSILPKERKYTPHQAPFQLVWTPKLGHVLFMGQLGSPALQAISATAFNRLSPEQLVARGFMQILGDGTAIS